MSTLITNNLAGLADPTYVSLPVGVVDPAVLAFQLISGQSRITIKKNSLDSSYFSGDFIADGSITNAKLATPCVKTANIYDVNVTTGKLADRSVTEIKIALGAVTNLEIASGTIIAQNLAANAVVTNTINNAAVTQPKLAAGCIVAANFTAGAVNTPALLNACVTLDKLGFDVFSLITNSSGLPSGTILATAASALPSGYLSCNGATVPRTSYPGLYTAIGTVYGPGAGDGLTFSLPDLRGRSPIGAGQGPGLTNRLLGAKGGEEAHTLTVAEMPSHSHAITEPVGGHTHTINEGAQGHSHGLSWVNHTHALDGTTQHSHGGSFTYLQSTPTHFHGLDGSPQNNQFLTGGQADNHTQVVSVGGSGTGIYVTGYVSSPPGAALASCLPVKTGITNSKDSAGISLGSNGGGTSHNNMHPYLVINYIIKQ